jgi:hypothetical protein
VDRGYSRLAHSRNRNVAATRLFPETDPSGRDATPALRQVTPLMMLRAGVTGPVGLVRRAALGFPAWAVVHDPANAALALAVLSDLERPVSLAATKPGKARDGYRAARRTIFDCLHKPSMIIRRPCTGPRHAARPGLDNAERPRRLTPPRRTPTERCPDHEM